MSVDLLFDNFLEDKGVLISLTIVDSVSNPLPKCLGLGCIVLLLSHFEDLHMLAMTNVFKCSRSFYILSI